jgi:hypothetical protein
VSPDSWACKYIKKLAEIGVTRGCGDGTTYCPQNLVLREEMAAFLGRAFFGIP